MPNPSHTLRWSAAAGLLAALLLVVMLTIGLGVGPNLAMLERPVIPTQFGAVANRHAGAIQAMMVVLSSILPLIGVLHRSAPLWSPSASYE